MKTEQSYELRWLFLREFTKHLILNSIPAEAISYNMPKKNLYIPLTKPSEMEERMMPSPMTKFLPEVMPVQKKYPAIVKPLPGYADLKKLNLFFSDPRVEQVECHGPNKNVLVKIAGTTQKTETILTKEEITEIIKEFSEKTRIPLIKGVFRAALGNLILTAAISDFVDTRFTIQKRAPFQQTF